MPGAPRLISSFLDARVLFPRSGPKRSFVGPIVAITGVLATSFDRASGCAPCPICAKKRGWGGKSSTPGDPGTDIVRPAFCVYNGRTCPGFC